MAAIPTTCRTTVRSCPATSSSTNADARPDRAAVGRDPARERLADDRHRLGADAVGRRERTAGRHRHAHRLEVRRRDRRHADPDGRTAARRVHLDGLRPERLERPRRRKRHRFHAGNGRHARGHALEEGQAAGRVRVAPLAKRDGGRQHAFRPDTGIRSHQRDDALDHQRRSAEQRERRRDLEGNEHGARPMTAAPFGGRPAPAVEPGEQPGAPRRGQRREAAHEGRQKTAGQGSGQDRPVDAERRQPAGSRAPQLALNHGPEQVHGQRAGAKRENDSAGGEQQRFEEEQPGDGAAARAERHPDGHLFLPACRADDHQRRDVGERDEEHERRSRPDSSQNRTHARHVLVVRRGDEHVPVRGEARCAGAHERGDACRRLGLRRAFTQPHQVGIRGHAQRREDVGVRIGVPEVRRQHAGDGERFGFLRAIADVRVEPLPDDVRIAAEAALPQAVADERDLRAAGHKGRRVETAAESRPHAEPFDEIRRDPRAGGGFRVVAADQVEHVEVPGDGMFDHVGERRPVQTFEIIGRVGARRGVADGAEALGARVRQPTDEVGIHRREHRRAERDAKTERQHRRGRKPFRLDQGAEGDAQICQRGHHAPEDGTWPPRVNCQERRL